jgi:hypothetical protein
MTFVFRLLLLAAGLLFAASLGLAAMLMLALWGVRAAWARLTGKPAMPFTIRIDQRGRRAPRANVVRPGRGAADISDVEPRTPQA